VSFGPRLAEFRKRLGLDQAQMAERLDVKIRTYQGYERGETEPQLSFLVALVREGADPSWILIGTGERRAAEPSDAVLIERLTFRASAGNGALVIEPTGEMVSVRAELLRRLSLKPEYARQIEADGDSMLPTIHHGDPLLIDVSPQARARFVDNKIYAFTIGDEAYVKRLRREPGRIVMVSDNRDYPERPVPAGEPFRIIGRVKWGEREL